MREAELGSRPAFVASAFHGDLSQAVRGSKLGGGGGCVTCAVADDVACADPATFVAVTLMRRYLVRSALATV
jgi:hypothetical protein